MNLYISTKTKEIMVFEQIEKVQSNYLVEKALQNHIIEFDQKNYSSKLLALRARRNLTINEEQITKVLGLLNNDETAIYNFLMKDASYESFTKIYYCLKNESRSYIEDIITNIEDNFKINEIIKSTIK